MHNHYIIQEYHNQNSILNKIIKYIFTWYGPTNKKSRLDKALVNDSWPNAGDCSLTSLSERIQITNQSLSNVPSWTGVPNPSNSSIVG